MIQQKLLILVNLDPVNLDPVHIFLIFHVTECELSIVQFCCILKFSGCIKEKSLLQTELAFFFMEKIFILERTTDRPVT